MTPYNQQYSLQRSIAIATLLIATLIAVTSGILLSSYRDTIRQEETNLHNLSTAFSAQVLDATRAIDGMLSQVQRDYLHIAKSPDTHITLDHRSYETLSQAHLLGVYLFDDRGTLLARSVVPGRTASAELQLQPRDLLRLMSTSSLQINVNNVDRATGRGALIFSRILVDGTGRQRGVILAQIDSIYFQQIFDSVDLGPGGSVTLLNRTGIMLVRGPSLPAAIGNSFGYTPLFERFLPNASHGAFEETSPVDGKRRLYGYDAVSGYPLVVITGMDKSVALSFWIERLQTAGIFVGLLALVLLFLAWRVGSESSRQAALIDRLKKSEARLEKSSQYFREILDALATPVWVLDGKRQFALLNKSFSQFFNHGGDDLIGRAEKDAISAEGQAERTDRYESVLRGGDAHIVEADVRDGKGEVRTVIQLSTRLVNDEGEVQIVNTLTDITDRKRAERRLAYLAEFDLLTELPNQVQFRRILHEAIGEAANNRRRLAVMIVSLERVQEVIDMLGHDAGDDVLKHVGNVLRGFLPAVACIARVKHSEFAVLVHAESGTHSVERFANELHLALSGPFSAGAREFYLGPLIGISLFPQDAASSDELFRLADIAKHRAGLEGQDPIHFFSESTHATLNERLTIEEQLRRALDRQEFRVVYQPKVEIVSGRIMGFEALLRWTNSTLGEVSPSRFVPIAESTGLVVAIGAWVMEQACRDAADWNTGLGVHVPVAVNLSLRQFHQKDLCLMIERSVKQSGLHPACLELEITESTAMSRADEVDILLNEIRQLGVALSIDDFGTGYSSLAYLKRFPVQRLKIDRAFVCDLGRDVDSAAIVRSIINLGHGLQLRIVAEGVETEEQLGFLRELGCDEYQGYLFSRPVDITEVMDLLKRNLSRSADWSKRWNMSE